MSVTVYGSGGTEKIKETKTITPSTLLQVAKPSDSDHELSQVTVNAMPAGALGDITVSSDGLITSKVSTPGYLGTNISKTKQLNTAVAQSYTPGLHDRIIINSGTYITGAQTVKGDANLTSQNIRKDVSLFGIIGGLDPEQIVEPLIEKIGVIGYASGEETTKEIIKEYTMPKDGRVMYSGASYNLNSYSYGVKCRLEIWLNGKEKDSRNIGVKDTLGKGGEQYWTWRGTMLNKVFEAKAGDVIKIVMSVNSYSGLLAWMNAYAIYGK